MGFPFFLFFVSVAIFFLLGFLVGRKNIDWEPKVLCLLFGIVAMGVTSATMYGHAAGVICSPLFMPKQIYSVYGQVNSPWGDQIAIIADSEGTPYAVWCKQEGQENPALPEDTKFAKVDKNGNLLPAD